MMIKKLTALVSVLFLSIISVWAIWDGNAVSGTMKEFPAGLFASSELFPKHTLIEIINLENNTRSRAVVIGSRGASGVLIRVSPDLAQALQIEKDRTVRVRVLAPSLVEEDGADPSYIGKNDAEKAAAAPLVAVAAPPKEVTEPITPVKKMPLPPEPVENTSEPVPPQPEQPLPPEPVENTSEPVPPEPEQPLPPEPVENTSEPVPPEPEQPLPPEPVESTSEPVPPEPEQPLPPEPVESTSEPVPPEPEQPLPPEPVENTSEPVPPEPEQPLPPEPVENTSEPVPPQPEQPLPPEPVALVMPVETVAERYQHEAVREVPPLQDSRTDTPQETDSGAIVPVPEVDPIQPQPLPVAPADMETPETVEPITEEVAGENETVVAEEPSVEIIDTGSYEMEIDESGETSDTEVLSYETNPVLIPAGPKEPVDDMERTLPAVSIPQEPLPSAAEKQQPDRVETPVVSPLENGAYYLQVAYYSSDNNVQDFRNRFGKYYPVSVEKVSGTSKPVYKVYIGPIKKDERGAILETFRKLGFKDAFIKKVP